MTADNVIDGQYDTQGWNRYAYVRNNPIAYKDPTGHTYQLYNDGMKGNAGERINNALDSVVSSIKNLFGGGNSSGASENPVKKQMLDNYDAKTKSTRIGNTKVDLSQITEPKKSIEGLNNTTANVLGDMTKKFDLSSMTISSLARKPIYDIQTDPHRFENSPLKNPGGGRGVDITEVTSRKNGYARLQGMTDSDQKFRQEKAPGLANEITKYLKDDPRVKQVITPWQVIDKYNTKDPVRENRIWNDPSKASGTEWQHKNHLHIGT